MLKFKLEFLAVVLLSLMLLSLADKPPCAEVDHWFTQPHQCRKKCPIVGPHYGHESETAVELTTDAGTCDEGLKCCQLYYYRSANGGLQYTDTGTGWPVKHWSWCLILPKPLCPKPTT